MNPDANTQLSENHGYDDQPAEDCPCCKNWQGDERWRVTAARFAVENYAHDLPLLRQAMRDIAYGPPPVGSDAT